MGDVATGSVASNVAAQRLERAQNRTGANVAQQIVDPVISRSAEAAAAKRLAAAAETAAAEAEKVAEAAAAAAAAAAEEVAAARREYEDLKLATEASASASASATATPPPATTPPGRPSPSSAGPGTVSIPPQPRGGFRSPPVQDSTLEYGGREGGGPAERHQIDHEMASLPMRSIKEIKKAEKALLAQQSAAAETATKEAEAKSKLLADRQAKAAKVAEEKAAKEAAKELTPAELEAKRLAAPNMESWAVTQAKKSAALLKGSVEPRNRFNLTTAPESKASAKIEKPHYGLDAWEMQTCIESKKFTQGAVSQDWWGRAATWTMEDYSLKNELKYQTHMKGKDVTQYQGIKPTIPVNEFTLDNFRKQQEEIASANKFQSLPAPTIETDSWLFNEAITPANKLAAEMAAESRYISNTSDPAHVSSPSKKQPYELFEEIRIQDDAIPPPPPGQPEDEGPTPSAA